MTMTIFELFCGLLTLFFPFQFSPTRGVNRNFCSISDSGVRYLKGQAWLAVKVVTGTEDHGAHNKNEQRSSFSLVTQKVFIPGNRAEMTV